VTSRAQGCEVFLRTVDVVQKKVEYEGSHTYLNTYSIEGVPTSPHESKGDS